MSGEEFSEPGYSPLHRILVVEDNEQTAYLLKFFLERAGYSVITAANGRVAQEVLDNVPPVDLILLDLMLPYVSGYQIIIDARESPTWRNVPIIVVSGRALEMDVVRALDMGANEYVTKPFRPEELLARVRRVIANSESGVAA